MNFLSQPNSEAHCAIVVGGRYLRIEDILIIADGGAGVVVNSDPSFVDRINSGATFLNELLEEDGVVYGVTTGYGDSCTSAVPATLVAELPLYLTRFHGCGMGKLLSSRAARMVMAVRLNSLAMGYSGVRWELLERLGVFINAGVVPLIPEEGSVGASGDLTPLSYVAALLIGERAAWHEDEEISAKKLHCRLGIQPLTLKPKEGLAIMNGTAMMTALACDAIVRAEYLTRMSSRLTALASRALLGNGHHFDERLFELKPHPGQQTAAGWIRGDLQAQTAPRNPRRLQDRYSVRCAPHVIGVLVDSLPWMREFIETELNSSNDNPLIDPDSKRVLHGGHFYGGHIAQAMDSLKVCVANLADLMDRQLALMVDDKFNHGLPPNLNGAPAARVAINHGLKAVQIGVSSWTAEALKLTMPASVFSRSTECHNQDKVSMGTIAARDCIRVLELTEQVAAAHILACAQAVRLRAKLVTDDDNWRLSETLQGFVDSVFEVVMPVEEDRPLEADLRTLVERIQKRYWSLYEE